MEENEFIPHQENSEQESKPKQPNGSKSSSQKTDKSTKKGSGIISSIKEFDWRKVRVVTGTLLMVYAVFLMLSCISYFLTWQIDQDKIIGRG
ncbi:MAG: hypothetical protein ACKO1R_04085, partial [Crocinitomicaceae bacterium]